MVDRVAGGAPFKCESPLVWRNRLRAARVWMDEFFELTQAYNGEDEYKNGLPPPLGFDVDVDLGDLSNVSPNN